MESINIIEALQYIKPEITISIGLLLIVIFDLIFHKEKKIIPFISLAAILIAGVFLILDFNLSGTAISTSAQDTQYGMLTFDPFAVFFKFLVLVSTAIIIGFTDSSSELLQNKERLGEYYTLIFGMLLGMLLLISATDLIMIYVALELMSLSSYVLAGFTKLQLRNSEAALKYLLYGGVSSGIMLFGISLVFGLAGTTNLYELHSFLQSGSFNLFTFSAAIIMIFVGLAYKISAVPFHFWTPDVYEGAPISITALLSVASKAAGFAVLIRFVKTTFISFAENSGQWQLLEVFDWQTLLVVVSILTMTLGNFTALWQTNVKRLLAYSSIAHAGYILLGLAVLSDQGLVAILIYFAFYLLMNLGAFYIVMLIANRVGSEEIDQMDGIGYKAPFLGVSLTIFLVSLTGLPPTAGFIGKLYLFIALVDAQMIFVAIIALLNTVISLYYYIKILKHMFLTQNDKAYSIPVNFGNIIMILILLVPILVFGVYFSPVVDFANSCIAMLGY